MSLECEIMQVPYDDNSDNDENSLVVAPSVKKPRKKRAPLSEEAKDKLKANLAKARAVRAQLKLEDEKERGKIEKREISRRTSRAEHSDDDSPPPSPVLNKRYKKPGPKRGKKKYYSSEEESESESESEPEQKPKRKSKTPKVKKVSEKEQRLSLLE